MDGIPVKINEKYKPPRKHTLPACVMNRLNNVQFTNYTYDFSLENMVSQHMVKLNKISREEIEKHEAKVSPEISPENPKSYDDGGGTSNEATILTPVPISCSQAVTISAKESSFKYSDFENDTSSPFDNEELKTLNDMEELAHVLGATSVSGLQSQRTGENCGSSITGISGNDRWPQMNNYGSPSQGQFYGNHVSYTPVSSSSHPSLSCPITYSSQMPMSTLHNSYQAANYQPYNAGNSMTPRDDRIHAYTVQDKGNNENDEEVSEIFKSLQDYLGHRKTEKTQNPHVRTTPILPKPDLHGQSFAKLNDQEQAMARRVGEMGFPLSRTAEAVRLFGLDESKIIEYLLLVQSFVDKGYTESQTVHALEANQCDEALAATYLEMLSGIMRLGFKEEEVVTALAETKNDLDKALDILISDKVP